MTTDQASTQTAKPEEFGATFDITTACRAYETKHAPYCQKHRSDIWAESCGLTLQNHNMFLTPQPEKIEECKKILSQINPNNNPDNKPVVILATTSDLNNEMGLAKNLTDNHVINLVHKIREMGLFPISIHDSTQEI